MKKSKIKPIALVTGAAQGIGYAAAKKLYNNGWYTIGIDKLSAKKENAFDRFINADISQINALKSVFDSIQRQEGCLDTLVNNAAVQFVKTIVETTPEEWDYLMSVNIKAAYLAIKYAHPLMKVNGGSIINVSSVHSISTTKAMAAYATSKGALSALTRAAALELAIDGIRVNAILPGAVDTEMLRSGLSRGHVTGKSMDEKIKMLGDKHALCRIGKPDEIAEAILFLADRKRSSFITGQELTIDGGAIAKLSTE